MTTTPTRTAGYLRFLGWVVAVAVIVALLGYLPARRMGGGEAVTALLAACAIGLVASALSGVPIALAHGKPPAARLPAVLTAMILRLLVAAVLGTAAVLSGEFARSPLLLGIVTVHIALLVVDTRYALQEQGTKVKKDKENE
jgi:hypothetical protein